MEKFKKEVDSLILDLMAKLMLAGQRSGLSLEQAKPVIIEALKRAHEAAEITAREIN